MKKKSRTPASPTLDIPDSITLLDLKRSLRAKFRQVLAENRTMVNAVNSHIRQAEVEIGHIDTLDRISTARHEAVMGRLDVCHDACVRLTKMANQLFDRRDVTSPQPSSSDSSVASSVDNSGPSQNTELTERRLSTLENQFHSLLSSSLNGSQQRTANNDTKHKEHTCLKQPQDKEQALAATTASTISGTHTDQEPKSVSVKDSGVQYEDVQAASTPSKIHHNVTTLENNPFQALDHESNLKSEKSRSENSELIRKLVNTLKGELTEHVKSGHTESGHVDSGRVESGQADSGRVDVKPTCEERAIDGADLKSAIKEFQDRIDYIVSTKERKSPRPIRKQRHRYVANKNTICGDFEQKSANKTHLKCDESPERSLTHDNDGCECHSCLEERSQDSEMFRDPIPYDEREFMNGESFEMSSERCYGKFSSHVKDADCSISKNIKVSNCPQNKIRRHQKQIKPQKLPSCDTCIHSRAQNTGVDRPTIQEDHALLVQEVNPSHLQLIRNTHADFVEQHVAGMSNDEARYIVLRPETTQGMCTSADNIMCHISHTSNNKKQGQINQDDNIKDVNINKLRERKMTNQDKPIQTSYDTAIRDEAVKLIAASKNYPGTHGKMEHRNLITKDKSRTDVKSFKGEIHIPKTQKHIIKHFSNPSEFVMVNTAGTYSNSQVTSNLLGSYEDSTASYREQCPSHSQPVIEYTDVMRRIESTRKLCPPSNEADSYSIIHRASPDHTSPNPNPGKVFVCHAKHVVEHLTPASDGVGGGARHNMPPVVVLQKFGAGDLQHDEREDVFLDLKYAPCQVGGGQPHDRRTLPTTFPGVKAAALVNSPLHDLIKCAETADMVLPPRKGDNAKQSDTSSSEKKDISNEPTQTKSRHEKGKGFFGPENRKVCFESSVPVVCVSDIPLDTPPALFLSLVKKCGHVTKVCFVKHRLNKTFQGTAYVTFSALQEAALATSMLNGHTFGSKQLKADMLGSDHREK